jgi:selenophosphate synthase
MKPIYSFIIEQYIKDGLWVIKYFENGCLASGTAKTFDEIVEILKSFKPNVEPNVGESHV